jgi:hypothetical protein
MACAVTKPKPLNRHNDSPLAGEIGTEATRQRLELAVRRLELDVPACLAKAAALNDDGQ